MGLIKIGIGKVDSNFPGFKRGSLYAIESEQEVLIHGFVGSILTSINEIEANIARIYSEFFIAYYPHEETSFIDMDNFVGFLEADLEICEPYNIAKTDIYFFLGLEYLPMESCELWPRDRETHRKQVRAFLAKVKEIAKKYQVAIVLGGFAWDIEFSGEKSLLEGVFTLEERADKSLLVTYKSKSNLDEKTLVLKGERRMYELEYVTYSD